MQARDIMTKGMRTIAPEATMIEVQKLMKERGFRHLPVFDGKKIIGILSDKDVQRALAQISMSDSGKETHMSPKKVVSQYMSSPVHRLKETDDVKLVAKEMVQRKLSCFVIENENSNDVGIITTEDLLIILMDLLDSKTNYFQRLKGLFTRLTI